MGKFLNILTLALMMLLFPWQPAFAADQLVRTVQGFTLGDKTLKDIFEKYPYFKKSSWHVSSYENEPCVQFVGTVDMLKVIDASMSFADPSDKEMLAMVKAKKEEMGKAYVAWLLNVSPKGEIVAEAYDYNEKIIPIADNKTLQSIQAGAIPEFTVSLLMGESPAENAAAPGEPVDNEEIFRALNKAFGNKLFYSVSVQGNRIVYFSWTRVKALTPGGALVDYRLYMSDGKGGFDADTKLDHWVPIDAISADSGNIAASYMDMENDIELSLTITNGTALFKGADSYNSLDKSVKDALKTIGKRYEDPYLLSGAVGKNPDPIVGVYVSDKGYVSVENDLDSYTIQAQAFAYDHRWTCEYSGEATLKGDTLIIPAGDDTAEARITIKGNILSFPDTFNAIYCGAGGYLGSEYAKQ